MKQFAHWKKESNPYWDWRIVEIVRPGDIREGGVILSVDDLPPAFCHQAEMDRVLSTQLAVEDRLINLLHAAARAEAKQQGLEVRSRPVSHMLFQRKGDRGEFVSGAVQIPAYLWTGRLQWIQVDWEREGIWLRAWNHAGVQHDCCDANRLSYELNRIAAAHNSQGLLVSDAIANNAGVKLDAPARERLRAHGIEPRTRFAGEPPECFVVKNPGAVAGNNQGSF